MSLQVLHSVVLMPLWGPMAQIAEGYSGQTMILTLATEVEDGYWPGITRPIDLLSVFSVTKKLLLILMDVMGGGGGIHTLTLGT